MERYVAIDNVCAWPNLSRADDGKIFAAIFNQPTHGGWEGDVECWRSDDDGKFWKLAGVAAEHESTTNRMNVAAGLARDGSLVVLASGWTKRNVVGDYSSPHDGQVLPMWVCRSDADGANWTHDESIALPTDGPETIIPFGDVIQLGDGNLGVSVYGWAPPNQVCSLFYVSTDDGRNWAQRGIIAATDSNETAPVTLPDSTLLAAVRTNGDGHIELYRSQDHGATWENRGPFSLPGQHPGHLTVLSDGRLLLSFGIRNRGLHAVAVRESDDGGTSWKGTQVLVDLPQTTDLGYPASVQADDGTIITAYYTSGADAHQRYHMGVLRWSIG
ncbi:MAG: sialidase family protein [Candidatus Latescibacteria bacterium]|jgi:hypothetical protein|nr:sialidase family protein [Candidatus Latescibacterota bacterium]